MSRRLASFSLLAAWLCASGAVLDVAQLAAWTRMFAGYARTESLVAAARETLDPAKPCAICRCVGRVRDASAAHGPAAPSAGTERMILIFERPIAFVGACARPDWPRVHGALAPACAAEVPVPPPRGPAQVEVS